MSLQLRSRSKLGMDGKNYTENVTRRSSRENPFSYNSGTFSITEQDMTFFSKRGTFTLYDMPHECSSKCF